MPEKMRSVCIIKFSCSLPSYYTLPLFYGPAVYTRRLNCPVHGLESYTHIETMIFDEGTSPLEDENRLLSKLYELTLKEYISILEKQSNIPTP